MWTPKTKMWPPPAGTIRFGFVSIEGDISTVRMASPKWTLLEHPMVLVLWNKDATDRFARIPGQRVKLLFRFMGRFLIYMNSWDDLLYVEIHTYIYVYIQICVHTLKLYVCIFTYVHMILYTNAQLYKHMWKVDTGNYGKKSVMLLQI